MLSAGIMEDEGLGAEILDQKLSMADHPHDQFLTTLRKTPTIRDREPRNKLD